MNVFSITMVNTSGPFHIADVKVSGIGKPRHLADLESKTRSLAAGAPQIGDTLNVAFTVTTYHHKNPGVSLLIGDTNHLDCTVEISRPDSGTVISTFKHSAIVDNDLNGPVGMVMTAMTDKEKMASKLNSQAASDMIEKIYGTKMWKSFGWG